MSVKLANKDSYPCSNVEEPCDDSQLDVSALACLKEVISTVGGPLAPNPIWRQVAWRMAATTEGMGAQMMTQQGAWGLAGLSLGRRPGATGSKSERVG